MKVSTVKQRAKGFTLIEILVVIAIIILLAGISFTVFSNSSATADRTRCIDNLHRLLDYGREFASRNGGMLPSSGMKSAILPPRECKNWWDALAPIVNEGQPENIARNNRELHLLPSTFRCPADQHLVVENPEDPVIPAAPESISYTSWLDNAKGRPMNVARGSALRGKPWLSDGKPIDGRSVISSRDFDEIVAPVVERHQGAVMVLYADGKIVPIEEASYERIMKDSEPK